MIIVGARVAGSILGTLVGEKGFKVMVLDRARFPADTLSTHFFRWPSFGAFDRVGILDEVYANAPKLTTNYNFIDGHVFSEEVEGPEGPSHHVCLRRITLDDLLVRRLRGIGSVTLRQGAIVHDLLSRDGVVEGVRWSENGSRMEATSRVVVGADGFHSIVAKEAGAESERTEPVHRAMYYAYFRGLEGRPGPSAEFHYTGNRLAYVFPTDGGLTLVAASIPIGEFSEFKKDPEKKLKEFLGSLPDLNPRIQRAEREGPVRGTGVIPAYQRIPYGKGWALVGDSAQIMDPWSGQGIDQASTHSGFLADAMTDWLEGRSGWEESMGTYHKRRNEFSSKTFERTCKAAPDFRPMTHAALKRRGLVG
jgi:flavin-dependent dehydrogenase